MVTIAEYRKALNDQRSSDEQIKQRLEYLEALLRNVIQSELASYVQTSDPCKQTERESL